MLDSYYTIKGNYSSEIEIKKSRFICSLKRVNTEAEAKTFIQELKKEHWKANHNCSAYILGEQSQIQRSSDDGEPSGTAGVPMLEVLKKNELIDVVAVVTRYFGGTKLGAGGLIRAYSHSVSHAIQENGIVQRILQKEVSIQVAYPLLGKLQHFLEIKKTTIKDTIFAEQVDVICLISEKNLIEFQNQIINLLSSQVQFKLGENFYAEIPVNK